MAFVDRTNVGLAKSSLDADVGIGAAAFGLGAGIFFLSYALLEVPSNLVMHRVGPRAWIARIAVTWGALCAAMMFVQDEKSFYVVRFLLGAAEAGLYPALMYVITLWFAQSQRVTMVGIIYLAVCAGLVLGGPVGGALMELDGVGRPVRLAVDVPRRGRRHDPRRRCSCGPGCPTGPPTPPG